MPDESRQNVRLLTTSASQNLYLWSPVEGSGENFFLFLNLDWQEKIFGKRVSCAFSDAGTFGRVLLVLILIPFPPRDSLCFSLLSLSFVSCVIRRKYHRVGRRHRPYKPNVRAGPTDW